MAERKKNPMGRSRKPGNPYLVFEREGWRWEVLKSYQLDDFKPYARWFLATTSPYTYGSAELGDGYVQDVLQYGWCTFIDPEIADQVKFKVGEEILG